MSQKDWRRQFGTDYFDQRAFSGSACDGTIFFTRDEDAIRFLRNHADSFIGYSDSDFFRAEEVIRNLA